MLRLACLFCLLASLADAGAWPRDQGRVFIASAVELKGFRFDRDLRSTPYFSSTYIEYGLPHSLTLGLHTGHGSTAELDARAFLRLPLSQSDPHRFAFEISAGQQTTNRYIGLGLSYGRGFKLWDRYGWLSVDTRMDFYTGKRQQNYRQAKLDLTLGLTHPNGLKTMAQLFATETNNDIYASFASGLVIPVFKHLKLETTMIYDLTHESAPSLKMGFWQEF